MGSKTKQRLKEENDVALRNFNLGYDLIAHHPMFVPLLRYVRVIRREGTLYPQDGLAKVSLDGYIYCHPKRREDPAVWSRAIAHCLLHLGMEHFKEQEQPIYWNIACDLVVEKFLSDLKLGKPPYDISLPAGIQNEEVLYTRFIMSGLKPQEAGFGMAGSHQCDMLMKADRYHRPSSRLPQWAGLFAAGLNLAVKSAVKVVAGYQEGIAVNRFADEKSLAVRAKEWFISSYPLLGSIASGFKIIEDPVICQRMDIQVAAISGYMQEIYINPEAGLTAAEIRFVMAHEFLHAALRHDSRHEWRDAYLWNVACDYVINQWLTEMGVGERPDGLLYDEQFKGLNAEAVYERIVTDMRKYRKLATLRGVGIRDIIPGDGKWWERGTGVDLDAFYRRALGQGLNYHQEQGRGYLPEGLIEDIRALSHPPISWDVELAHWFDEQFQPLEKVRSYARPSRRQSSTPDIPRPNWSINQQAMEQYTFGVILDTSGSMERSLLAVSLGAIASYSIAREVPGVRVVFCDADAYDQGYMRPEDIAGTVKVKGRGGTVLQPAIELLEHADDFPKDAPVLVITDGYCEERLVFYGREHAFLLPEGGKLPFIPKGKVFRIR